MGNLAVTYSALGRHSDALAMQESVLEFRRRVLPLDHPSIGERRAGRSALLLMIWVFFLFFFDSHHHPKRALSIYE